MTFTTWFRVTAIMDGTKKYIWFYYLTLTSCDLFSPTTVPWQNSHQKNLFATMKKPRYVWYPCSLWASLVASFFCIYFKILSIISESISNRSCFMYSLRLHCFIVLDHPTECMPATLGTRLFSTAASTLKNSLTVHIHDIESLSTFKRLIFLY